MEVGYLTNFLEGGSWYVICILAAFAAILLHGIILSISKGFSLKRLEATSKAEILQGLATVFFIIIIVSSVTMTEEFMIKYFLGEGSQISCGGESYTTDSIKTTFDIVKCRFQENAERVANVQLHIKKYADECCLNKFVSKSTMIYVFGVQVYSGSWTDLYYKETEHYRIMNNFSTSILISVNILLLILKYLSENMLTIFLPVGLFLRSFSPTRGIGAFFIATAIGFYFIFPTLFVFLDPGFVTIPPLPDPTPVTDDQRLCYPTFAGTASQIQASAVSSSVDMSNIRAAAKEIAKFNVYLTVHPFVVFSITLIFVRYMIYILGGEAYSIMRYVAKVI